MADAEMSSVDPIEAKLTQCEREYFLLISAANHSEWLRDPLDEVGDATGPLRVASLARPSFRTLPALQAHQSMARSVMYAAMDGRPRR